MPRRWLDPAFFNDEKLKKATVPERFLAAALIANQDDDGRLRGEPADLRDIAFKYDNYSLEEIQAMRDHLAEVNPNIIVYKNAGDTYIQLRQHKKYQNPRYYHPSKLPPPSDWSPKEQQLLSNQKVTQKSPNGNHPVTTQQPLGNIITPLDLDLDLDLDSIREGEVKTYDINNKPSPSLSDLCTDKNKILDRLLEGFRFEFGKIPAEVLAQKAGKVDQHDIIPREPMPRERAQIRDLATELVQVGGCPLSFIREAFREAASQQVKSKMSVSYVRAILFGWLGVQR